MESLESEPFKSEYTWRSSQTLELTGSVLLNRPTNALSEALFATCEGYPDTRELVLVNKEVALPVVMGIDMLPLVSVFDVIFIELDLKTFALAPKILLFIEAMTPLIDSAGGLDTYEPLHICGYPSVLKAFMSAESNTVTASSTVSLFETSIYESTPPTKCFPFDFILNNPVF
jgi:hypothetical protein